METVGQAKQRHKLELRAWQSSQKALVKKWKSENMSKKEIESKLVEMENEIKVRHDTELDNISKQTASTDEPEIKLAEVIVEKATSTAKLDKAQRKRDKKKQEEKARQERIANESRDIVSKRQIECDQIADKLKALNMAIKEVPSDGHCMYHAIADQLKRMDFLPHMSMESHVYLRLRTAKYLRSHANDFLPFVELNYESDVSNEDQFEEYCKRVEESSDWGGQIELRALAQALEFPIEVHSATTDVIKMGEEFSKIGEAPLRLSYHLHYYSLGEHYNSVVPLTLDTDEVQE
ncbi:unnamed protein product [Aphanomyces euteiches]